MKKVFAPSELIINPDNSSFHLHITPEQLADKVVMCGDPDRVDLIAKHFDSRECDVRSREFHTITGTYKGKRITAISHGIGCDNIDIVVTELDALKNIDFATRTEKKHLTSMEMVRIGTCGGLQSNTPVGTFICSEKSIGFEGLLNYYADRDKICDLEFERAFAGHLGWDYHNLPSPYVVDNNKELLDRIYSPEKGMVKGVTISCGGFYGPQGREIRIPLSDPHRNEKIESFEWNGYRITNFEMESSALAGLAKHLGHRAMTVCMVIANRIACEANTGYKNQIDDLIKIVLEKI
ncbi:MAG: nucleoside phosphorylase [Bacteroidaceae bacterium]|nr:nucleoside phosphorylase [Bacteroidaceae bacterium]